MSSLTNRDRSIRPHTGRVPGEQCRIDRVVILAGEVRATRFTDSIGCHRIELPVSRHHTLMAEWAELFLQLAREQGPVDVAVQLDLESPFPAGVESAGKQICVRRDPSDYRGTAGLLRDLSSGADPEARWLVVTGAQLLAEPLNELLAEMFATGGDVTIYSHRDGTPGGLTLLRPKVLDQISDKGFVDFKEQALGQIARHHEVRVISRERATAWPIRTLGEYIHALRERTLQMTNPNLRTNPFAEQLESAFTIIDPSAEVDPSVKCHDSVVLADAKVEAGATLIRSVVGVGAKVAAGQRLVDRLVAAPGRGGA